MLPWSEPAIPLCQLGSQLEHNSGRRLPHLQMCSFKKFLITKMNALTQYISDSPPFLKFFFCLQHFLLYFFFFYWTIDDIQYYVSFRCNTKWFYICIYYEMITTISLTIVPIQSYYNIIDHIPYGVHYIPVIYLLYNWRCVPLNPLHQLPLHQPPPSFLFLFIIIWQLFQQNANNIGNLCVGSLNFVLMLLIKAKILDQIIYWLYKW